MIRTIAIAALLAATPAHAEMCFTPGPLPPVAFIGVSPDLAGSGGVVVGSGIAMPDWRFRGMNETVRARVVTVAPGLAIYHPPPLPSEEVVLENAKHEVIARRRLAFSIEPPPLAPVVAAITSSKEGTYTVVVIKLAGKPPATALIAIVSRVDGRRHVPLTWARVRFSEPGEVLVWHSPYGCAPTVSTLIEPRRGERVVVTWVDDAGRLSEPSKPIVVKSS